MKTVPYAQPYGEPQRRIPNQGYVRQGAGRPRKESSCCASLNSILSTLILIGVLAGAGVYLFVFDGLAQLQAIFGFGSTSSPQFFPTLPPVPTVPTPPTLTPTRTPTVTRPPSNEYVEIQFVAPTPPPGDVLTAFENARQTWSDILVGNEINPLTISAGDTFTVDHFCSIPNDATIPAQSLDHLLIAADISTIDGSGGTLGFAGPCRLSQRVGNPAVDHPIIGRMVFDTDDLDDMVGDGTLERVILHEMGHVLGIGTLWDPVLESTVFAPGSSPGDPGTVGAQPLFNGHAAMQEYEVLTTISGQKIPVEDGSAFGAAAPSMIAAGQGRGSIDGHWRETVFTKELMTPQISSSDSPMSEMTIRSLEDIGYAVDASSAEAFTLSSVQEEGNPQALQTDGHVYDLRGDAVLPRPLSEMIQDSRDRAAADRRRLRAAAPEPGPSN